MDPAYDRSKDRGHLRASDLPMGAEYELHEGHAVACMPTGGDGARAMVAGAEALATDPDAREVGVDPAYTPDEASVYAPDLAVGNVPNERGRISGVPRLAVEYASVGQDEASLQDKIQKLLALGTELVWLVRLLGPRRVEVFRKNASVRLAVPGDLLEAPGILRFPVPVEALFESEAAHDVAFRNLLAGYGYTRLEAVREEAREEGREEGRRDTISSVAGRLRDSIFATLSRRGLVNAMPPWLQAMTEFDQLVALLARAETLGADDPRLKSDSSG